MPDEVGAKGSEPIVFTSKGKPIRIAYQRAMKLEKVELARTTVCMALGGFVVGRVHLGQPTMWFTTPRNVTCHTTPPALIPPGLLLFCF